MRRVLYLSVSISLALAVTESATAETLKDWQRSHNVSDAGMAELKRLIAKEMAQAVAKPSVKPATAVQTVRNNAALPPPASGLPANRGHAAMAKDSSDSPWAVYLRQDWQDIGVLGAPTPTEKATGASISYTDDRIAKNSAWAVRGTGVIAYRHFLGIGPTSEMTLYEKSFAAYASVNRLFNSNSKQVGKNVDTVVGGGAFELGWRNTEAETQNYLIVRGGFVNDKIKDVTTVDATAAWKPVSAKDHIGVEWHIGEKIGYRFDPQLLAQYASTTDSKTTLDFSNRRQSLRVGPQLSLTLFPYLPNNIFWSRLSATVVYHWWYETLYGNTQDWLKSAVTYNLDDSGYIALTGSYQRGHTEETGALTNIFMLSLNGKFGP